MQLSGVSIHVYVGCERGDGCLREEEEDEECSENDQAEYDPSSPCIPGAVASAIVVGVTIRASVVIVGHVSVCGRRMRSSRRSIRYRKNKEK